LTINNTLTLLGTNVMEINKTAATRDLIQGLTSVTYGGTLSVVNLSGTLAAGDSFKLYDATSYSGAFSAIIPSSPGAGLGWDTSSLTVDGTLKVVTAVTPPYFNQPTLSGGTLTLTGGGGSPNATYHLLASTNVELPVSNWTSIATNNFDGSGNFNLNVTADPPRKFFMIRVP
jgi:hypothetical protein